MPLFSSFSYLVLEELWLLLGYVDRGPLEDVVAEGEMAAVSWVMRDLSGASHATDTLVLNFGVEQRAELQKTWSRIRTREKNLGEKLLAELKKTQARIKATEKRLKEELQIQRRKEVNIRLLIDEHETLQKRVAIKKIDLQGLMMEDILTEIRVLRMNTSPQIVNYLDSYLIHEELWLVMEFMDGGTLYEAVEAFEMTEDEMGIVSRE
ncbi:hypothetical protein HGM15179_022323, partial [Zosterops borbonicus]